MFKDFLKSMIKGLGYEPRLIMESTGSWSIRQALHEQGLKSIHENLRKIVPDISQQYSRQSVLPDFNWSGYWEQKIRALHAFQCTLMLRAIDSLPGKNLTVVDIGDSAGNHMLYLRELSQEKVETISVNLDPRAIDKISKKGLRALLCRAEELDLVGEQVDLFVSFEMVEHLHNPAIFFRRLAKKSTCNKMLITVPYLKTSRVGLYQIRNEAATDFYAEDEHIFELSPQDWTLLLRHSGWGVIHGEIYYQYPRRYPGLSQLLALYWRKTDFEGFWGAILEKDTVLSDRYLDWEE
jgi:hypothetical protein